MATKKPATETTGIAQFRDGKLLVNGIHVPFVPCRRCKGNGKVVMGTGVDAGLARCANCQGKGKLFPADIIRNQQFRKDALELASEQAKTVQQEFEAAMAAGAGK